MPDGAAHGEVWHTISGIGTRLQVGSGRLQGRQLQWMSAQVNVLQRLCRQENSRGQPQKQTGSGDRPGKGLP